MGAQMQRGAYSRVCGASTAKRPAALGYAGAGPALEPYRAPPPTLCIFFDPHATCRHFLLHDFTEEEW